MRPYEIAEYDRIVAMKAERAAEIKALQAEHNRCAWDGIAVVDAGRPYCLTHTGRVPA